MIIFYRMGQKLAIQDVLPTSSGQCCSKMDIAPKREKGFNTCEPGYPFWEGPGSRLSRATLLLKQTEGKQTGPQASISKLRTKEESYSEKTRDDTSEPKTGQRRMDCNKNEEDVQEKKERERERKEARKMEIPK